MAYRTFGKSVRESKLIVDNVSTVVIPKPKKVNVENFTYLATSHFRSWNCEIREFSMKKKKKCTYLGTYLRIFYHHTLEAHLNQLGHWSLPGESRRRPKTARL